MQYSYLPPTAAPASHISYSQHVTLPLTTATADRSLGQYIACFMIIIFCISVCDDWTLRKQFSSYLYFEH